MIRGYFIHHGGSGLGVQAKLDAQVRTLSALGEVSRLSIERSAADKIRERLPLMGCDLRSVRERIVDPGFLYIRKWVVDRPTLGFLHDVKEAYPECVIVLEIPTYPYDAEMASRPKDLPFLLKDRHYRTRLRRYVDRIVTFYGQSEIFGIPTIKATNGIDVSTVRRRQHDAKKRDQLDLIAVATMTLQHGYDRVLQGMADYYRGDPSRRVILHLVGEGQELARYRAVTRRNDLEPYVVFHGLQTGATLDALYDHCDIGLIAFGMYRIGARSVSALKSREYLARGIPMIGGCPEDIFVDADFPYYLEFPNDDTAIPITEVLRFFDRTVASAPGDEVTEQMRQFALSHCDMSVAMAPVLEYLACNVLGR